MDHNHFDAAVRALARDGSRRSLVRQAVRSAVAGPFALTGFGIARADGKEKGKDKDKGKGKDKDNGQGRGNAGQAAGAADRDVGHPCAGNQTCRAGLYCWPTGPGSVPRCTDQLPPDGSASQQVVVQANNQVCAGNCEQTNEQTVIAGNAPGAARPSRYWIDVACQFDAPRYMTRCTCVGRGEANAAPVRKITLPTADLCAVVVSEAMLPAGQAAQPGTFTGGEANAGTGGVANADASGGNVTVGDVRGDNDIAIDASGGTANADASGGDNNVAVAGGGQPAGGQAAQNIDFGVLELTLEGEVVPGKLTTYWVDTDQGRRPAPGPALVQVANETPETGTVIAEARTCPIAAAEAGFDWFGQCTAPATGMAFNLFAADDLTTPLATVDVNAQGRSPFGGLAPGTYQLQPVGQAWCYAESDNVDAQGQVIVEAGLESHVWTFICGS